MARALGEIRDKVAIQVLKKRMEIEITEDVKDRIKEVLSKCGSTCSYLPVPPLNKLEKSKTKVVNGL